MSDAIEPALTREEWASLEYDGRARVYEAIEGLPPSTVLHVTDDLNVFGRDDLPALIALANAALPADDPRKITRAHVALLRDPHTQDCSMWWLSDYPGAQQCDCGGDERLDALADAIAAYLPPEDA